MVCSEVSKCSLRISITEDKISVRYSYKNVQKKKNVGKTVFQHTALDLQRYAPEELDVFRIIIRFSGAKANLKIERK